MPTKKKPALHELSKIHNQLLEQFGGGLMTAEASEDTSTAFKKALIAQAFNAELGHHLRYPPGAQRPEDETNQRNGKKRQDGSNRNGPIRLDISRDREGTFRPF